MLYKTMPTKQQRHNSKLKICLQRASSNTRHDKVWRVYDHGYIYIYYAFVYGKNSHCFFLGEGSTTEMRYRRGTLSLTAMRIVCAENCLSRSSDGEKYENSQGLVKSPDSAPILSKNQHDDHHEDQWGAIAFCCSSRTNEELTRGEGWPRGRGGATWQAPIL